MKLFFEKLAFTIYGIIRILLHSKIKPGAAALKIKEKESCYILGNGPALVKDIEGKTDFLTRRTLFVVNFFAKSDLYTKFCPKYYVVADPIFYHDETSLKSKTAVMELLSVISQKTTWPLILFVPSQALEKTRVYFKDNENIRVVDYNIQPVKKGFSWFIRWVHDKQLATFGAMNVVNVALYLAVFLGFEEINLLGINHSWHLNFIVGSDNLVYQRDYHFDDKKEPELMLVPTDPDRKEPYRLHELLECSAIAFRNYFFIKDYAESKNVKIYNCCSASFVDAFERKQMI